MKAQSIFKGIIVLVLMASIALFNTVSFAQFLQDDKPGIDKPPLRMTGGQHIMMHDDEIVGFLTPPEDFTSATLRGWMFYPDGSFNLTTHDLDMWVNLNMSPLNFFGLTATATGRMHTTDNDAIFVCSVKNDDSHPYLLITEYDPATGRRRGPHLVGSPDGWWASVSTPNLSYYLGRYIDCATSDINGNGQDELVIAYHGQDDHPELVIAAHGWTGDFTAYAHYLETGFTLDHDKSLAVTTGDFDGDGDDEIALAVEDHNLLLAVLLYDVEGGNIIKKDGLWIQDSRHKPWNRLDIASGDLDGDGNDEIVATSSYHRIDLIDVNATTLKMTLKEYVVNPNTGYIDNHIATGDLDGDGDDEVVVGFQTSLTQNYFDQIGLDVFDSDNNLGLRKTYGKYVVGDVRKTESYAPMGFDIVMGNFDAKIDETQYGDIGMEVALVYRTSEVIDHDTSHGAFRIQIYDATAGLGLTKKKEETILQDDIVLKNFYPYYSQKVVVAAGDFDGDSVAVGEPDHWVIEGHHDFSAVIAEPPKHIDYIKETEEGNSTELNVSRKGGAPDTTDATFFTKYEYTKETDTETTDKSGTDYDWGVQTEVEIEKDFGIPKIGEVKAKIEASAGYDYSKKKEEWNIVYQSTKVGKDLKAINDDYLVYRSKNIHVWRYPIIGETEVETKDGKKGQLYIQVTFPSDKVTYNIEGRTLEWYQPVHESGNIFSYPWDKSQIENLGDIKTKPNTFATGSNEATFFIDWTNAGTNGTEVSTEKKVDVDASVSLGGEILEAKTQVKVKGHYDKTWSSLHTSETTNSQSHGISVYKCPFDDSYAYQFSPFIYENSKLGVLQVDYTVDPRATTTIARWWNLNYNQLPDLALNLPFRWHSANGVEWEFNEGGTNFHTMKGLFFLDSDGKPFGYSIEEGEPVTVKARVYNYSFVDVSDVEVKIEGQYDECNATKTDNRFEIETVPIPSIQGFMNVSNNPNWKYAEVVFETTGRAGKYYCFWVTVDPANKIQEMANHDNGDTYENNKGYFGIPLYVTAQSGSTGPIPEGDLFHEVIAISDDAPVEGEAVLITANVYAADRDFRHVDVYFYDGDPDEGGKLFDIELIPYIVAGGSYTVRVPYNTYGKIGAREIYIVIEGKIGEHTYTNNTDSRVITVQEKPWRDEVIDLLK